MAVTFIRPCWGRLPEHGILEDLITDELETHLAEMVNAKGTALATDEPQAPRSHLVWCH